MKMKPSNAFTFAIFLALLSVLAAFGTSIYVQPADTITLTWANVSPATGTAIVKCSSVASNGAFVGVSLTGSTTVMVPIRVALTGVYTLPVIASFTIGNVATGDYIFATVNGAGTCTTVLSNIPTGILFGQAFGSITASTAPGVIASIPVLLRQPTP